MHSLDLPAGSPIRLSATARPNIGMHRWDLRVLSHDELAPVLIFGSQIGGLDREQHVDIPAQTVACRVEISVRHATVRGWQDDQGAVTEDTPDRLEIGFCDASSTAGRQADLSLSLVFTRADPTRRQEAIMAKGQKRTNRETRKPKQNKPKPEAAPRSFLASADRRAGAASPKGSGR